MKAQFAFQNRKFKDFTEFFIRVLLEKSIWFFVKSGDFERLDMKNVFISSLIRKWIGSQNFRRKSFWSFALRESKYRFQKVAQEIGTKYSIGYYSSNENATELTEKFGLS